MTLVTGATEFDVQELNGVTNNDFWDYLTCFFGTQFPTFLFLQNLKKFRKNFLLKVCLVSAQLSPLGDGSSYFCFVLKLKVPEEGTRKAQFLHFSYFLLAFLIFGNVVKMGFLGDS